MKSRETLKQTEIGQIPDDWNFDKLENYAEIKGRIGWKGLKKSEYTEDGPYLIANRHIKGQKISWENCDHVTRFRYEESPEIQLSPNDIIMSKDGTIGQVAFIDRLPGHATINSTMMLIRIKNESLIPKFVYYFLQGNVFKKFISQKNSGTSIPHIFQHDMKNLHIPIPSKKEQQKITLILSTVDGIIQKSNEIIRKTKLLNVGLMKKLLTEGIDHTTFKQTEIGQIPEEWTVTRIIDAAETYSGGTPSRKNSDYFKGTIPWVKSGELKNNSISDTAEKITQQALDDSSAKKLQKGILLVAMYGATVGKTAILDIDATTNQAICAIKPKSDNINTKFLQSYFIFKRDSLLTLSSGGAQPNISQSIIKNFMFPLPSILEQNKIVDILSIADSKLQIENKRIKHFSNIKQGLLNDFLSGYKRLN